MRRDYFTCTFLICVCASLFFVCFLPIFYTYEGIVFRTFGLIEILLSCLYTLCVLLVIPIYSALRKKVWIAFGLGTYGVLALLPTWMLPSIAEKLSGEESTVLDVIKNFILKSIYEMVNAPFAASSAIFGVNVSVSFSKWILPMSAGVYIIVQLYRYYRDAYIAEQLNPADVVDSTAKENRTSEYTEAREIRTPDILGTVISAPVTPSNPQPKPQVRPAPQPKMDEQATQRVNMPNKAPQKSISDKIDTSGVFDENGAIRL